MQRFLQLWAGSVLWLRPGVARGRSGRGERCCTGLCCAAVWCVLVALGVGRVQRWLALKQGVVSVAALVLAELVA